jgi:hypothetical protein
MASNVAFRAFACVFASKREHVTAMAAPIGSNVRKRFEAMWNTVVDFLFVAFPSVGLGYTLGDNFFIALFVASVSTILALISEGVEEKIVTERTEHELVELSLHELVAVHFMHFTLALPDSSLSTKTAKGTIQWALPHVLLNEVQIKGYGPSGLNCEPGINPIGPLLSRKSRTEISSRSIAVS